LSYTREAAGPSSLSSAAAGSADGGREQVDRDEWLRERRRVTEERHDTLHAPTYDQQEWAAIFPTHRRFVARLVERCPPGGRILDAACGTGKYFGMVLDAGRRVVGTDQSAGMLAQARAKHPDVPTEKVGLQELAFDGEFDAVMCVDAMENVFPEDWPLVLANLRRAVRPGGPVYLTVELPDERELERVYAAAVAAGLPVVPGEYTGSGGGYHYYPSLEQVAEWVQQAGLRRLEDGVGDDYYHLLAEAAAP
jgi:ubiquinone/menaquinone biosynthesis C-methylase UbiE